MAQADYVVSNGTGAAVRADLNGQLAAIVSNNSGATAPATTYAYQWWADTTTNTLKLRNSANSAWIEIMQLDGTLTIEDGTVSAPGLAFRDDLNTGIFRPSTDQFAISTNGVERVEWGTSEVVFNDGGNNYDFRVEGDTNPNLLFVDASADAVGIGNTPSHTLDVNGGIGSNGDYFNFYANGAKYIAASGDSNSSLSLTGRGGLILLTGGNNYNNGTERARIDSSGRLLVGTTTTSAAPLTVNGTIEANSSLYRAVFGNGYVDGDSHVVSGGNGAELQVQASTSNRPAVLSLGGAQGASEYLGAITFFNSGNTDGKRCRASIVCGQEGSTANQQGGVLTFSTTADGASSPTERMRIGQNGNVTIGTTSSIYSSRLTCQSMSGVSASVFLTDTASEYGTILRNTATSGNNRFALFETEAAPVTRGSITYNRGGGVVAYNTTSDYRAKTLLGDVENPGETIDALKVYRGVMNGATVERPMLVAHEAQQVAPYCVTGEKDGVDDEGNPIYQQMDHQVLVPLLIVEIQQLRARVAALEAQ